MQDRLDYLEKENSLLRQQLHSAEQRFQLVFQNSPVLMAFTLLENGKMLEVNQSFLDVLGFERDEVIGHTGEELGLYSQHGDRSAILAEILKEGFFRNREVHYICRNGSPLVGLCSGRIVEYEGQPCLLTAMVDITKLHHTQQALETSEQLFRSVFNLNPALMALSCQADGRFVEINKTFERTLGYTRDEVVGHTAIELNLYVEKEQRQEMMDLFKAKGRLENHPTKFRDKFGQIHNGLLSAESIEHGQSNPEMWLTVVLDITKRIELEEHLTRTSKMEALGNLAGGIAHDFNNILTAVMGYAQLVKKRNQEPEYILYSMDQILTAGHRAKGVVDRIRTFSRQMKTEFEVHNLSDLVEEALVLVRPIIPGHIHLETLLHTDSLPIRVDPTQFHQMFTNLAHNAIQALQEKGDCLKVATWCEVVEQPTEQLSPGHYACLLVEDNGKGIEYAIQDKIFEPFFTTRANITGTGLGLSMVHGIVAEHQAHMTFQSEPGQGTQFNVYFPITEEQPIDVKFSEPDSAVSGGGERILLVDDEELILSWTRQCLEEMGYHVVATSKSKEAALLINQSSPQFDLLLIDYVMPDMNGLELCQLVHERFPDLPFVLMTGYSQNVSQMEILDGGIKSILWKPFGSQDLLRKVRAVLDQQQSIENSNQNGNS